MDAPKTRAEALERVKQIDGWLNPEIEAGALYDLARAAKGPIVEIGSWQGRSTAALAFGSMAGNKQPVYAIDSFVGPKRTDRESDFGNKVQPGDASHERLRANLNRVGAGSLVEIVPLPSTEAVPYIPDCDVLFVDGDHDYHAVHHDLRLYLPKVLPNGSVMLHDVTETDPGVPKAVDELMLAYPDKWRFRGRYSSALIAEKKSTQRHKVYLACPGRGFVWGMVRSLMQASRMHSVSIENSGTGWDDFNFLWADAHNECEAGNITHFAMLHSDVAPQAWFLDVLLGDLDDYGVDLVSTVIPIKDDRGLTSTGIGEKDQPWQAYRRLTMPEVMELPETFSLADMPYTGDPTKYLLHNTGCWVCDLRKPCFWALDSEGCLKCHFDFPTRVKRSQTLKWANLRESEDWFFSRRLFEVGATTLATRKVRVVHEGSKGYSNDHSWGQWKKDEDCKEVREQKASVEELAPLSEEDNRLMQNMDALLERRQFREPSAA